MRKYANMSAEEAGMGSMIYAQICRRENTQFLRSMPVFKICEEIPAEFDTLLSRLEAAERNQLWAGKRRRPRDACRPRFY